MLSSPTVQVTSAWPKGNGFYTVFVLPYFGPNQAWQQEQTKIFGWEARKDAA
jgi:hypothetical protein